MAKNDNQVSTDTESVDTTSTVDFGNLDFSILDFDSTTSVTAGGLYTSPITPGIGSISINDRTTIDDLVIQRVGKPPLHVAKTLEMIMDRLAILEPEFEKLERYPALREAYENYKLIEAMVAEDTNNGKV